MKALLTLLRQLFCRHEWRQIASPRYAVMRSDGSGQEGEVTLHAYECNKCGEARIVPADRIHFPK